VSNFAQKDGFESSVSLIWYKFSVGKLATACFGYSLLK